MPLLHLSDNRGLIVVDSLGSELGTILIEKVDGRQLDLDGISAGRPIEIRSEVCSSNFGFAHSTSGSVILSRHANMQVRKCRRNHLIELPDTVNALERTLQRNYLVKGCFILEKCTVYGGPVVLVFPPDVFRDNCSLTFNLWVYESLLMRGSIVLSCK